MMAPFCNTYTTAFSLGVLVGVPVSLIFFLQHNSNLGGFGGYGHDGGFAMKAEKQTPMLPRKENVPSPIGTVKESTVGKSPPNGNVVPPPNGEFATNFTFPSRQERIKYYMGGWYGRTLTPKDVPCREIAAVNSVISDAPVLWKASQMRREMQNNGPNNWLVGSYLVNAYGVIGKGAGSDQAGGDRWVVLLIGDSHTHNANLPAISKTRFSRFATSKITGETFFDSIIWPLEMNRHYKPVIEYTKLEKEGKVTKWEDKKATLIWRGTVTGVWVDSHKKLLSTHKDGGSRIQVVGEYYHQDINDVDVAFKEGDTTVRLAPAEHQKVARLVRGTDTSMEDQMRYKYILNLEGHDVATGLKWQLASNSVVFMSRPTTVSFMMEDLIVPFVHYIPLKDDYSDLIEMVHWARRNDKKCKWISEQATLFMDKLFLSKEAKAEHAEVRRELGETYHRQFGEAVKSCADRL